MFPSTFLLLLLLVFTAVVVGLGLAIGLVVRLFVNRKGTRHV